MIDGDPDNALGLDPRAASPSLIHVTVSPFGLAGPRAGWLDSELVAQAAGGLLFLSGDADHPPAQIGFPLAHGVAGAQAACAVLIALAQRRRTGAGARIDVSRQESVACLLFNTEFMAHVYGAPGRRGDVSLSARDRRLVRRTFWRCADGHLTWNLWTGPGMGRKNESFFEWMRDEGVPEAAELLALPWERMGTDDLTVELLERVNRVAEDFFARRGREEFDREALARRVLLFAVRSLEDVAANDQLLARRAFGSFELPDGRRAAIVARPARSTAYPIEIAARAPALGADTEAVAKQWSGNPAPPAGLPATAAGGLPFEGIRVLDFGWALVSPLTTRMLAVFGADVVKLEYRRRPDMVRMTGPYPGGRPGMDAGALFVSVNASKRSLGVDMNHPEGRDLLHRMATRADVVCENFTPGTAARLGYGYEDFRAVREDIVMMSLSMQGQTGPRADQPGFGNHLQAMSGLDHLTGFPDGRPQGPNQVLPDFIGPWLSIAALVCALEHRRRTGEGQYLDISQFEAIMLYLQPALIECGVTGASPERVGPDLSTPARLGRRDELDAALAAWTDDQDPHALAGRLQARGVRAYPVCDGRDMLNDPQLAFRGHYFTREHAELGESLMVANAFRIGGLEPRFEPGPLYASGVVDVLDDWLQLDPDELGRLIEAGAIVM